MSGLKLVPEITINDVNTAEAGIFILPGGDMWEQNSCRKLINLLYRLHSKSIPIAAICGATWKSARAGLTNNVHHTSNSQEYLKAKFPNYQDEAFFVDELAITDRNIITASGLGSIEFGREIIKRLDIFSETDIQEWFDMYKHGVIPAKYKTT